MLLALCKLSTEGKHLGASLGTIGAGRGANAANADSCCFMAGVLVLVHCVLNLCSIQFCTS